MSHSINVALIQHANQGGTLENQAYIAEQIITHAGNGAQLIVLQELHNAHYFCQSEDTNAFDLAETIPGPSTNFFAELAKKHKLVIVTSLFERRAAGLYHNTAVVIDSDGSIAGKYRKMHIPDDPGFYEKFYFTPGDLGFTPIQTSVGKLGVLVCWDQWYPEAARLMALGGAELLIYPTAIGWDRTDNEDEQQRQLGAWQLVQRGHAVANGLPVLVCNRVGYEASPTKDDPGIEFWGNSFIVGPQGELLAKADIDATVLTAEVSLRRSEDVRRIWPFLRDRRIDSYNELTKRFID